MRDTPIVIYLVPDLLGSRFGIARHSRIVCRTLEDLGVDLEVVALHDRAENQAEAAQQIGGLRYIPCEGRRLTFIHRALQAVRRRPDLILAAHPHFAPLAWLVARPSSARFVSFAHGVEVWTPLPPLRRWAFRRADLVLCVSRHTAERAIAVNRVAAEKTLVLPNCLDPAFALHPTSPSSSISPSLLTVGRMSSGERYKGHEQVIRALPTLLQRFPDLVYHIVGDGDDRPRLEALAAALSVDPAVRFHGVISESELAERYAHSTIFIMPSAGEGFGLVYVEAMAHGKPVIAGRGDAGAEVVRHGETGLVVDPENSEELIAAIDLLLRDPALRCHMGAAGLRSACDEFGFQRFKENLHRCLTGLGVISREIESESVAGVRYPA